MQLLDIGNTNIKIYKNSRTRTISIKKFDKLKLQERFYYICVNQTLKERLKTLKQSIDVAKYFKFKTNYRGLGVDRVAACYSIKNGVVVDIGSAISIDVMQNSIHQGGILLPGITAFENSFKSISPILNDQIDFDIDLNILPNSTKEAISFGVLKSIILLIWSVAKDKKIYFTGGDGKMVQKFFENSVYKKNLVFDGMKKAIMEREC